MAILPKLAALIALSALAACATPQQRCESQVSAEQRHLSDLLREVENNLARGYAWENELSRSVGWQICGGYGRFYYASGWGYSSCYGGGPDVVRERVAIDPVAETRKRDMLQARLAKLSEQGAAYCQSRYGAPG